VAAIELTRCDSAAASLMAFRGVSVPVVPVVPVAPVVPAELVELVVLAEHPAINARAAAVSATAAARRWPPPLLRGECVESRVMAAG
jgi:hypothetical protein